MKKSAKQLTTHDWLDHALQVLAQQGLAAVAVEPLAKSLGVTKGSFYWHFSNRQQLISELLKFWQEIEQDYLQRLLQDLQHPEALFKQALTLLLEDDTNKGVFLAISNQQDNEEARRYYVAAVERRHHLFKKILKAAGFSSKKAELQASQLYVAYLGMIKSMLDNSLAGVSTLSSQQFIRYQVGLIFTSNSGLSG